jgi:hypothetical protein
MSRPADTHALISSGSEAANCPDTPLNGWPAIPTVCAHEVTAESCRRPWPCQPPGRTDFRNVAELSLHTATQWLHTATQWLWTAAARMEVAHRDLPVPADGRTLLHAIPANTTPARQSPVDSESVPELCDGIMVSAERLRQLARAFTGQARWSPDATSLSWRTDAHCSAILCHASDITVRTLTERAGQLGAPAAARRNAMQYGEHRAERPQPEPAAAELDGLPGVGQIEGTLRECHVSTQLSSPAPRRPITPHANCSRKQQRPHNGAKRSAPLRGRPGQSHHHRDHATEPKPPDAWTKLQLEGHTSTCCGSSGPLKIRRSLRNRTVRAPDD